MELTFVQKYFYPYKRKQKNLMHHYIKTEKNYLHCSITKEAEELV